MYTARYPFIKGKPRASRIRRYRETSKEDE